MPPAHFAASPSTTNLTVGFVGIGAMGLPMACNVLDHASVVVYDLDVKRVAAVAQAGATVAQSPRAVAAATDAVVVMVATPAQLDDALFGAEGAAADLRAGQPLIIMSSVGVNAVRDLAVRLEGTGMLLVDAPVTGGVARATTGELTVLVGAPKLALAAAEPVLHMMASTVALCGSNVGDGQAVKLVNQLLCSVHLAAAAEALASHLR